MSASTRHNGRGAQIVAFVAANPGSSSAQIFAATGAGTESGLLTYIARSGKIHRAGPHSIGRYYPTAEEAQANDGRLRAEAVARTAEVRKRQAQKDADKRRVRDAQAKLRREAEQQSRPQTKPARLVRINLPIGTLLHPNATATIAPPFRDRRFEPEPNFERAITRDWYQRRLEESPR